MEKEWNDVESFVCDLRTALDQEAKTIRETDLDWTGGYHSVFLQIRDAPSEEAEVLIDALGRVILPAKGKYLNLVSITFLEERNGGSPPVRVVGSVESRFRGDRVAAYVIYLKEDT
jgi:hypothetical protein